MVSDVPLQLHSSMSPAATRAVANRSSNMLAFSLMPYDCSAAASVWTPQYSYWSLYSECQRGFDRTAKQTCLPRHT
jgi:hypothetical protein